LRVELCIGSASAAALGAAEKPSGHCFAMLVSKLLGVEGAKTESYILEGTNWIAQKRVMGIHGGDMDDLVHMKLIHIATCAMELTKELSGTFHVLDGLEKDHGRALAIVKEKSASAFWRAIYTKGNSLMASNEFGNYIYGVRAYDVIGGSKRVKSMPLTYSLATLTLRENGIMMDADKIQQAVRDIGTAESVPAWKKGQWDKLINSFLPCEVVEGAGSGAKSNQPEQLNPIRIAFTHQIYEQFSQATYRQACQDIRQRLQGTDFSQLQKIYKTTHDDWVKKYQPIVDAKGFPKYLKKRFNGINVNFETSEERLQGINMLLQVERTYICMQSIVVVCTVDACCVDTLHTKLMGWVSALSSAFEQRSGFAKALEEHKHPRPFQLVRLAAA
jgi:hypothetical protein